MDKILNIPHRISHGMCPVNGIRDLVQWRSGRDWSNEFLWGLGQGGGFAYLRFSPANPPRQVYTGISTPRQHRYLHGLAFWLWRSLTYGRPQYIRRLA
jgi:hypothetical protein